MNFGLLHVYLINFGCPQFNLCCDVDIVDEVFRFIGRAFPDTLEALEVDEATELDEDMLEDCKLNNSLQLHPTTRI